MAIRGEHSMDLLHAKAEFEAGRLNEAVAEVPERGGGWRLMLRTAGGETVVLTDHSGRERLFNSLDHVTEVGRDIGFGTVRIEEHF